MTHPNPQLNESRVPALDAARPPECKLCHEEIPVARMAAHPHIAICLECMSEDQRTALQDDLELAARVQRELLPSRSISYDGWEFSYIWEPFGSVSGDHIDLLCPVRDKGPLHLLLGDVSGKGVAASLLQSNLHALFRALAPVETSLSGLFGRASSLFFDATASESYATLTGLRLFPDGRAELANAGHPRPLIADERGVRPVEDASLPLGMFDGANFSERQLKLDPGETLLLYTDGWTEAEVDGEMYGVGRAAAALRRSMHLPLPELLAACRADMERFLGGAPRNDDLTLVALRRTESR